MEKKLNMNQYNEIKKAENVTLLSINPEVINEALKQGKIKVLAQHGNNIYYLCNSMRSNTVLMHINKNYYTVIDRFIDSENGKLVNTVKQLTKFSFFCVTTGSRRIHIMTNIPVNMQQEYGKKTDYLPRMLVSLEKYGEVLNLNKEYDVHHKGTNFDNRQKMMMYMEGIDVLGLGIEISASKVNTFLRMYQKEFFIRINRTKDLFDNLASRVTEIVDSWS